MSRRRSPKFWDPEHPDDPAPLARMFWSEELESPLVWSVDHKYHEVSSDGYARGGECCGYTEMFPSAEQCTNCPKLRPKLFDVLEAAKEGWKIKSDYEWIDIEYKHEYDEYEHEDYMRTISPED